MVDILMTHVAWRSRKRCLILFCIGWSALFGARANALESCRALVNQEVRVAGVYSLADLLRADSCQAARAKAERVRLGSAPLAGSPRVFSAQQVRELLERAFAIGPPAVGDPIVFEVPDRVVVRCAGSSSPCASASVKSRKLFLPSPGERPLVSAGETVMLVWEQAGIRLVIPAVCLDPGAQGQRVRARITGGGRIVQATVVSAGNVRASI